MVQSEYGEYGEYGENPEPEPNPEPELLIRRDVGTLAGPWHPIVLAYARAIAGLQQRPDTDPRGWTYLSAVHGTNAPAPDPDWNQCQHGSWFFLPWHRMYLHHFERIVRAEVLAQGGPADWALPYWNYADPGQRALPPEFRQRFLPKDDPADADVANPLFVAQRQPSANAGGQLPAAAVDPSAALNDTGFTPPPAPGFGGGKTTPQHFFGAAGDLEFTPHNIVHSLLGGWMGDPNRAASDPIFWLHHCNIDRLWEQWLTQAGRSNPTDAAWTGASFVLHNDTGVRVTMTPADVLHIGSQLGYRYDSLPPTNDTPMENDEMTPAGDTEPELAGSSTDPVELSGDAATVAVTVEAPVSRGEADAAPARIYVNLEDIEAERNPSVGYEVYLRIGAGDAEHYLGTVSFFGIEHVNDESHGDGPHGMRRTFDVTDVVGARTMESVEVSFRPLGLLPPDDGLSESDEADEAESRTPPVRIGRVSVTFG
ncbi:tyrosinase family protein [Microbacteriaceae bacterium VKM Ac-2854]|nr:tyrosinase family protein [Microbacteriaceae bacterium VKM Ac-2854]